MVEGRQSGRSGDTQWRKKSEKSIRNNSNDDYTCPSKKEKRRRRSSLGDVRNDGRRRSATREGIGGSRRRISSAGPPSLSQTRKYRSLSGERIEDDLQPKAGKKGRNTLSRSRKSTRSSIVNKPSESENRGDSKKDGLQFAEEGGNSRRASVHTQKNMNNSLSSSQSHVSEIEDESNLVAGTDTEGLEVTPLEHEVPEKKSACKEDEETSRPTEEPPRTDRSNNQNKKLERPRSENPNSTQDSGGVNQYRSILLDRAVDKRKRSSFRVRFGEEPTTFFIPLLSHKDRIDLFISRKEIKMNKILDINRKQREKEYQKLVLQASGCCNETPLPYTGHSNNVIE